ncbi:Cytochrome P450 [Microbispora rosea]|uniref:Cytochrome P450 n=1 Tax=Microbispora rosea TaxID=58117 RepID=A0A1N7GCF9_9ACTN|nr:hypothetical protein Mro03_39340 [Microbispora rosea subsp. rosea]SIS10216.1 Cytochrome P450 [Microbispora rosea]
MTESLHTVTPMPAERQSGCPFDPPKELVEAREHGPISRFPFPDGHQGWLVTGYDLVRSILAEHLDAMEKAGPQADLVTAFAKPIPAIVICELLGVPYEDRGRFQDNIDKFLGGEASDEELIAAYLATQQYLAELVAAKRANPTDDVLTDLLDSDLTDEELQGMALILLSAGFDTTANMLALGTFALLENPDQLNALRADPTLVDQAVEELLRYLSVAKQFYRVALEDVELAGHTVRRGRWSSCPSIPPTATPTASPTPTPSTCAGRTAATSPSVTASTSAWASSSPVSRCASRSPRSSTASPPCAWPYPPKRFPCARRSPTSTASRASRSPGTRSRSRDFPARTSGLPAGGR